ncbi:flagellar brake domain-containing protein [Lysinibacillus xylanilyticus]|uniref:flagellar brake domain-containing protein n=1 Tax=Lysinibacillus xylanilyticus TaxID=582475 RepID=UPI003801652E
MNNSIFNIGDTLHIEILNSNGELEQRLYSQIIKQDKTSLLIKIPTCIQLNTNIYLQPNTTFITHFEAVNNSIYMFKSVVLGYTYHGPFNYQYMKIQKPRKRFMFSDNKRTGLKVKTNLNGYITQEDLSEKINVEIISLSTKCSAKLKVPVSIFNLINLNEDLILFMDTFCGGRPPPTLITKSSEDMNTMSIKTNILRVDKINPHYRNIIVNFQVNVTFQKLIDNFCYDLVEKYLYESKLF